MTRFMIRPAALARLVLAGLVVAGCTEPVTERVGVNEAFILKKGWFSARTNAPAPPTLWCYRTLGVPDCYDRPQPGRAEQLLGAYAADGTPVSGVTPTR